MKIAARLRTVLFSAMFSEDSQNTFGRITHPKQAIVDFSTNPQRSSQQQSLQIKFFWKAVVTEVCL